MTARPHIAVIGGGPAGLAAAEALLLRGFTVTLYDRMPSLGRKFLLAGRGGLNLTYSEPLDAFLKRYGRARDWLKPAIAAFPPDALRDWADGLGAATFIGSSGRVFPKAMKASPLLRSWLRRLDGLGLEVRLRHRWTGFDGAGAPVFDSPAGTVGAAADATLLALGGGSWGRLGSDGCFVAPLAAAGVEMTPLAPANCGFEIAWSPVFAEKFAGTAVKRIAVTADGVQVSGEALVTAGGIEGGAIYAVSRVLRSSIERRGPSKLTIDLKPQFTGQEIVTRLQATKTKDSAANRLRKALSLPPVALALLREGEGPPLPAEPSALAERVKAVQLTALRPFAIDRAISTAGGVARSAVDDCFMLKALPGVFVAGEMLDWEAPTGGYLLQACCSTGRAAAAGIDSWLTATARRSN